MTYNLTNLTGVDGILGFVKLANELTRDVFGIGVLFGCFVIAFMSFMNNQQSGKKSFAGASFITFVLAVLLRISGIMTNDLILVILALFLTIGVVALYSEQY